MMGHSESTVLAVVVDPGRLAAGIVDQRGEVLVRDRIGTPTREVWRALEQLVRRVLAARPDEVAAPSAVAVSCAGPIDEPAGSVSPEALPAWSGFPLRRHVEELTGLPVVLDTLASRTPSPSFREVLLHSLDFTSNGWRGKAPYIYLAQPNGSR